MTVFLKLFRESILSSFHELGANRLRAFLSVLGITIGIFCIISVFSAVDSLENNVKTSFRKLGENVIYVQRFPWSEDPRANWVKFFRRPSAKYSEFKLLQERLVNADAVAIMLFLKGKTAKHGSYVMEDVDLFATTHDYYRMKDFEFDEGRYFSFSESQRGTNVALIGGNIAAELFPNQHGIAGRKIKMMNREIIIAGVLKKEGDDIIGMTYDNNIIIPYNYAKTIIDVDGIWTEPFIAIKSAEGITQEEMMDETRGVMRSIRKLKPRQEDNFALNQVSVITSVLTAVFGVINTAGGAIGLFSILVGGFGIANIMFVSVKERTPMIGIKKALGAKRIFILLEFLMEATVLSVLGGLIGLLLVYAESFIIENVIQKAFEINFAFELSLNNATIGILLSIAIGLVAGFIPALFASLMKPVDAIRA